jgi:hypothetical protein
VELGALAEAAGGVRSKTEGMGAPWASAPPGIAGGLAGKAYLGLY